MADLLCKTAKIVVLAMYSRVAYPLLLRELGGLHGKALEAIVTRKYRFILLLLSTIFLFSQTGTIYCQERNEETKSRSSIHPAL
jgi:hypothetical protein